MCAQKRFRSDCTFVQPDQNLRWAHFEQPRMQFIHVDNEDWRNCMVQADLSLQWVNISDGTFSHVVAITYNSIWFIFYCYYHCFVWLIELGFNDTSTLVGHFVSSPREREKIDRRDSRRDEREGQGRKRNRNESEETEEIKTSPPYPYLLQG